MDDLDEVLNESIMDSIMGKRRAAEAHTKKKRKRRADDDDDDDDEDLGYHLHWSPLCKHLQIAFAPSMTVAATQFSQPPHICSSLQVFWSFADSNWLLASLKTVSCLGDNTCSPQISVKQDKQSWLLLSFQGC